MERKGGCAHERGAPRGLSGDAERMSGVLDRMIQRSRGRLPAIEPLVRSEKTAATVAPLVVESRRRNAAGPGGEPALREESAKPVHDKVARNAAQASAPARKDTRRFEALELASAKRTAESDGTPAAKGVDPDGWKRPRPDQEGEQRDVAHSNEEPHDLSIELRTEKLTTESEGATGQSVRRGAMVDQRAPTPDLSAARKQADVAASANDEPEHTDIHITIGSVELRAPRVAPVAPKVPPFRPLVTLDEFLKRESGSSVRGAKS
jgi:hypothetical protein